MSGTREPFQKLNDLIKNQMIDWKIEELRRVIETLQQRIAELEREKQ